MSLFRNPCTFTVALLAATTVSLTAQGLLPRVIQQIDETHRTVLAGNVRSVARDPLNDRGALDAALPLHHIQLQLKRSPESEAALTTYIAQLNDSTSPNFHKWLNAQQLAGQYGAAPADVAAVTAWLESHGLTIDNIDTTNLVVDFSGSVQQVETALHPAMHSLSIDGVSHIANTVDPSIPSALTPVIAGVVSLADIFPQPMHRPVVTAHIDPHTGSPVSPDYAYKSGSATYQAIVPGDLATIYNLTKLFNAGYSGQGQTIVIVEDTDVYSTADWTKFRSAFGLSAYSGASFTQEHPGSNCSDPGATSSDGEAILDAEWASAAAPSAAIVLASCANTSTTFGVLTALQNVVASSNPPKLISISYGESESEFGAAANSAFYTAYKNGAAEGISIFAAAGDQGAASSDAGKTYATHGITASGMATTPYNIAVGGTDFGDVSAGSSSSYWSTSNSSTYASAKSYIPEIPWNSSCGSVLLAKANGYSTTYGSSGFCNSSTGKGFITISAGSGGPSSCAGGTPSTAGVASSGCEAYGKPSWQSIVGNPSDGVRDIPDVSLFAANGAWGHYYIYCNSDTKNNGASCSGAPTTWSGAGGTSFATPIMAAIQALVNQQTKSSWGQAAPTYYNLAKVDYGSSGNTSCSSSNTAVSANCTFYDVVTGDMDVPCTGSINCYLPSGTYGVLSTSSSSYKPGYGTGTGWDFATGLGTINAYNLVANWGTVSH